jgi:hypothetical protein
VNHLLGPLSVIECRPALIVAIRPAGGADFIDGGMEQVYGTPVSRAHDHGRRTLDQPLDPVDVGSDSPAILSGSGYCLKRHEHKKQGKYHD